MHNLVVVGWSLWANYGFSSRVRLFVILLFSQTHHHFAVFAFLLPLPTAIADELGENLTDEELQEMIREADVLDYDGKISRDEFFRVMKRENAY